MGSYCCTGTVSVWEDGRGPELDVVMTAARRCERT